MTNTEPDLDLIYRQNRSILTNSKTFARHTRNLEIGGEPEMSVLLLSFTPRNRLCWWAVGITTLNLAKTDQCKSLNYAWVIAKRKSDHPT